MIGFMLRDCSKYGIEILPNNTTMNIQTLVTSYIIQSKLFDTFGSE